MAHMQAPRMPAMHIASCVAPTIIHSQGQALCVPPPGLVGVEQVRVDSARLHDPLRQGYAIGAVEA